MATPKTRNKFFDTEEGLRIEEAFQDMSKDARYNTDASYSPDVVAYPDNLIPFVEKHKAYLTAHPRLDARMYLANLRLMTRRK